jgi:hypothetical protein
MITAETSEGTEAPEATISALSDKVQAAEEALLEKLAERADAPTPKTLQTDAQDGLSPSVMSIAFWRLVNRGAVELDSAGRVHGGAVAPGAAG